MKDLQYSYRGHGDSCNQEDETRGVRRPSSVTVEMIKAGGREIVTAITGLVNKIINEEPILEDWKDSSTIKSYTWKGDATNLG